MNALAQAFLRGLTRGLQQELGQPAQRVLFATALRSALEAPEERAPRARPGPRARAPFRGRRVVPLEVAPPLAARTARLEEAPAPAACLFCEGVLYCAPGCPSRASERVAEAPPEPRRPPVLLEAAAEELDPEEAEQRELRAICGLAEVRIFLGGGDA